MRDALWLLWDKKRVRRFCGAPKIFDCSVVNACHGLQHLILLLVQALLHGQSFRNVDIDHLSGPRADHAVGLALGAFGSLGLKNRTS